MAPPRGPSLLADLRKEDLLFIFNTTLNGVPKLDKRKELPSGLRSPRNQSVTNTRALVSAMLTLICGKKMTTCPWLQGVVTTCRGL